MSQCVICIQPAREEEDLLCTRCKNRYMEDKQLGKAWIRKKKTARCSKIQRKIFNLIKALYPDSKENVYPPWSVGAKGARLEFDIIVPSLGIVIEVQGPTHFCYTPGYHRSEKDFEAQIGRDTEKTILASVTNWKLLHIYLPTNVTTENLKKWLVINSSLSSEESSSLSFRSSLMDSTDTIKRMGRSIRRQSVISRGNKKILRTGYQKQIQKYFKAK